MPESTGRGSKHRSRRQAGTSKIVIHYPDMATWRALTAEGYTDEEIDEMNPFSITFPATDMSEGMFAARKMVAMIVDNNDLKRLRGERYESDKEDFFLSQRDELVSGLKRHKFHLTGGSHKSETWTRDTLSGTNKRLTF